MTGLQAMTGHDMLRISPIRVPISRVVGRRPCCSRNRRTANWATAASLQSSPAMPTRVASCLASFGSINWSPLAIAPPSEADLPASIQTNTASAPTAKSIWIMCSTAHGPFNDERRRSAARGLGLSIRADFIASPLHRVVRKAILAVVNLIVGTTPLQRPQVSHALAWLANRQPSRKVQLLSCPIASAP